MKTRPDAEHYVTTTLGDYVDDFDIDAIIDEVHDYLGHYDFDQLDTDEHMDYDYNAVLQKYDRLEMIYQGRIAYLSALAEAEELKQENDELIRESIKDKTTGEGAYSMYAIAKKLHMSESAIAYIRDQK